MLTLPLKHQSLFIDFICLGLHVCASVWTTTLGSFHRCHTPSCGDRNLPFRLDWLASMLQRLPLQHGDYRCRPPCPDHFMWALGMEFRSLTLVRWILYRLSHHSLALEIMSSCWTSLHELVIVFMCVVYPELNLTQAGCGVFRQMQGLQCQAAKANGIRQVTDGIGTYDLLCLASSKPLHTLFLTPCWWHLTDVKHLAWLAGAWARTWCIFLRPVTGNIYLHCIILHQINIIDSWCIFLSFWVLGIEPRASCMLGKCTATELQFHPCFFCFFPCYCCFEDNALLCSPGCPSACSNWGQRLSQPPRLSGILAWDTMACLFIYFKIYFVYLCVCLYIPYGWAKEARRWHQIP